MGITTTLTIGARTDVGQKRDHNEDDFIICKDLANQVWNDFDAKPFELGTMGSLLMVADGMGGAEAGEEASRISVNAVKKLFSSIPVGPISEQQAHQKLKEAFLSAHQAIVEETKIRPEWEGMGTTAIVAWVIDNKAYIAWSGDSRCYLYNKEHGLKLMIDEHSYVWGLVRKGDLTPEEARLHPESNIITQNLGDPYNNPDPETKTLFLKNGDRLLLCSDGLNSMISDTDIENIFASQDDTAATCSALVNAANEAGGGDNITIILMDVTKLAGISTVEKQKAKSTVQNAIANSAATATAPKEQRRFLRWLLALLALAAILTAGYWMFFGNETGNPVDGIIEGGVLDMPTEIIIDSVSTDTTPAMGDLGTMVDSANLMEATETATTTAEERSKKTEATRTTQKQKIRKINSQKPTRKPAKPERPSSEIVPVTVPSKQKADTPPSGNSLESLESKVPEKFRSMEIDQSLLDTLRKAHRKLNAYVHHKGMEKYYAHLDALKAKQVEINCGIIQKKEADFFISKEKAAQESSSKFLNSENVKKVMNTPSGKPLAIDEADYKLMMEMFNDLNGNWEHLNTDLVTIYNCFHDE